MDYELDILARCPKDGNEFDETQALWDIVTTYDEEHNVDVVDIVLGKWHTFFYAPKEDELLPDLLNAPGVYIFMGFGPVVHKGKFRKMGIVPVYIGTSDNLKNRITQHIAGGGSIPEQPFYVIKVRTDKKPFERLSLEARLIDRFRPIYNKKVLRK